MITVLWICNTPLPEIQDTVGVRNYNEGWLVGISNQLRKRADIILHYAFPQNRYQRTLNRTIDGITFWGFHNYHKNPYKTERDSEEALYTIINRVNPDIIHIFGTEFPHALECMRCVQDKKRLLVSLQGLVSELARVYTKGIPYKDSVTGKMEGLRYQCLLTEKMDFYKRGLNEKQILLNIKNVIGRTDWDEKCVRKRNKKCRYYHCDEILRDVFYEGSWQIENVQRYSIFMSQSGYPIKGLHVLLAALSMIREKYPDVMVYIAGDKSFLHKNTSYGCYIKKIIKKYQVEKNLTFLGFLTAEKIKERLIKAHVMVMPSLLENSPNSIGEAMILGTPIVAADVGGISSIMSNRKEGYLYTCTDKKALAQKICKIFSNDRLALWFSENGRRRAEKLYNRTDNLEQLLKIYSALMCKNNITI